MSLLETIRQAGVAGAGGAGFPTYAKLDCQAEYLLVNGAECEPLLRVDQTLMAQYPEQLILGAMDAAAQVGAEKVIIGVKSKHSEEIALLERRICELRAQDTVSVGRLPDVYPTGDEMVLVYQLTGRIVPEMGIPKNVGCVVINVETCLNIYWAEQGEAVTEKYVTVAGDVPEPKTVRVPVGTPISDVIRLSGAEDCEAYGIIRGGPMMGSLMEGWNGYVTKKDKGFIVLRKTHPLIRKKACPENTARRVNRAACEQCRRCTDLCPRYLLGHNMQPHKLMRVASYAQGNVSLQIGAALCSQCNLCEYFSCPAGLYPRTANAIFKRNLAEAGIHYQGAAAPDKVRESRPYRLTPSKRLILRLGLREFDRPAPWTAETVRPQEVRIATKQSAGAPARILAPVGQRVQRGETIGSVDSGTLGLPIHASIDGVVAGWDETYVVIKSL